SRKYLGALLLGLYKNGDLIYVGRTGGGFNDRTLAQVHKALKPLVTKIRPFKEVAAEVRKATWVEPRLVCEVRFNEWTSDRKLRAPIFQGFRDDVDPKDCRLEDSIPNSPPKLGGVAAPSRTRSASAPARSLKEYREATEAAADGLVSSETTPPFAKKRANGTPPNLGGMPASHSRKIEFTNLDKIFWSD